LPLAAGNAECLQLVPRNAILALYIPSSCVCLSHSGIVSKWLNVRLHKMPHDSTGTLIFWCQRSQQNSNGITPYWGAKYRWGRLKSATFDK